MTKALLILPDPPMAYESAATKWYHSLVQELGQRQINTTVVTLDNPRFDLQQAIEIYGRFVSFELYPPVSGRGGRRLTNLVWPLGHWFPNQMRDAIYAKGPEKYDVVFIDTIYTAKLLNRPVKNSILNALYLHYFDFQGEPCIGLTNRIRQYFTLRHEKQLLSKFQTILSVSDRLTKQIQHWFPNKYAGTLPLTLDYDLYPKPDSAALNRDTPPTVGLIGSFPWPPTKLAAKALLRDVWPKLSKLLPDVRMLFAGRQAAKLQDEFDLPDNTIIESDPEDIVPSFRKLDVLVYLPQIGSGVKVKIIEAILMGIPVVTNEEGAEGLPEFVRDRIVANSLDDAIQRILKILQDRKSAFQNAVELRTAFVNCQTASRSVDKLLEVADRMRSSRP